LELSNIFVIHCINSIVYRRYWGSYLRAAVEHSADFHSAESLVLHLYSMPQILCHSPHVLQLRSIESFIIQSKSAAVVGDYIVAVRNVASVNVSSSEVVAAVG
jgi:hypothetical protein